MKKKLLVKVGTKILTRENQHLNYNLISDLLDQIFILQKQYHVLLVSSGAAGAGREFFEFKNEKDPSLKKQMLASVGQGRLFQVYSEFFREKSIFTAQALITKNDFISKTSFQNIKIVLENLLKNNIIPIINENDVTSFRESSFGDNDQLAALTASMMQVDLMVILSDISGFYTANPKTNPEAKRIERVEKISSELLAFCEDSLSTDGTGGMYSKLKAAELATQFGIPTIVASGREPQSLLRAVRGENIGTFFPAGKRKKLSDRGNWMITGANIKGSVIIDDGAHEALVENKSLLAVGVKSVEGSFNKKDVILITNKERIRVGVGLSNYDSNFLNDMIKNKKDSQGMIVIHKNHLYTL